MNGKHIAIGPTRSSPLIWYYDTLDIAPYLEKGQNEIRFVVVRYFATSRSAIPFVRTPLPGLTVIGNIETGEEVVNIASSKGWTASVDESIQFPTGLADDVFLHVRLTRIEALNYTDISFIDQRAHLSYKPQSCCYTDCLQDKDAQWRHPAVEFASTLYPHARVNAGRCKSHQSMRQCDRRQRLDSFLCK